MPLPELKVLRGIPTCSYFYITPQSKKFPVCKLLNSAPGISRE